jgi:hypothetical protein
MSLRRKSLLPLLLAVMAVAALAPAQSGRYGFGGGRFGRPQSTRADYPTWEVKERFEQDVLTFVRIQYSSYTGGSGSRRGSGWRNDYPDSDINFSFRLQELTSMEVATDPIAMRLTDERLLDYPFLYLNAPGRLEFSDDEARALRRHLLNGGLLMMDDFWGREEMENVFHEMRKVFPEREPVELPLEHPIFQLIYPLERKPQVPSIQAWSQGYEIEPWHGDMSDSAPYFKAILNDQGQVMALMCHNNDLGDGWEREGESVEYFKRYAEKWSYPVGINIMVYMMTH